MHLNKVKDVGKPIYILIIVLFTAGVFLGTISFFHLPDEIAKEVTVTSTQSAQTPFLHTWKSNFINELIWIISVWMLSSISFAAPMAGVVVALRGFLTGFSVAFIISKADNYIRMLLSNILPQTLVALPILTIFVILSAKMSIGSHNLQNKDSARFILGAVFVLITIISSALETGLSLFFRNM